MTTNGWPDIQKLNSTYAAEGTSIQLKSCAHAFAPRTRILTEKSKLTPQMSNFVKRLRKPRQKLLVCVTGWYHVSFLFLPSSYRIQNSYMGDCLHNHMIAPFEAAVQ